MILSKPIFWPVLGEALLKRRNLKFLLPNLNLSRDPDLMFPSGAVCQHVGRDALLVISLFA